MYTKPKTSLQHIQIGDIDGFKLFCQQINSNSENNVAVVNGLTYCIKLNTERNKCHLYFDNSINCIRFCDKLSSSDRNDKVDRIVISFYHLKFFASYAYMMCYIHSKYKIDHVRTEVSVVCIV